MKKIISIALLAAMVLSCFAGCAMQKGEIDADAYAVEGVVANVAYDETAWAPKKTLDTNAPVWNGTDVAGDEWVPNANGEYEIYNGAQLRKMIEMINAGTDKYAVLEGVTFKLMNDINLGGHEWGGAGPRKYFAGTFDGQGYAIGNYKYDVKVKADVQRSFFGGATNNACIKNVSFINATYTNMVTDSNGETSGALFAFVATTEGNTITIKNIYSDVDYVVDATATKTVGKSGAFIGKVEGSGALWIENCENAADITLKGIEAAGIINWVGVVGTLTIKDCKITGSLTSSGSHNAGIIGYMQSSKGDILIEDCTVSAPIQGAGDYTAGIIGFTKAPGGNVTIKNCNVTSSLVGTQYMGGILGNFTTSTKTLKIENCHVTGNITGSSNRVGGMIGNISSEGLEELEIINSSVSGDVSGVLLCGGVVGYIVDKLNVVTIKNVQFTGDLTASRSSAGIIGYLTCVEATIENVTVNSNMNFDLNVNKNQNAGGLIGRINSCMTLDIKNCVVEGSMKVNYNASEAVEAAITYAGGLIGYAYYTKTAINISNCKVGTENAFKVELTRTNNDIGAYWGTYIGGARVSENEDGSINKATATFVNVFQNADITVAGEMYVDVAGPELMDNLKTSLLGYQTKENTNGTYDLRYVFGMKDEVYTGVGVDVIIRSVKDGNLTEKAQTVYVEKVYNAVTDNAGTVYAAADYCYDYLYTLVVEGIPAEYTFEAGNLEILLTSFGANVVEGDVVVENGNQFVQGADLAAE